jgi:holo-[acyl-carrier protein] synthase
MTARPGIDLVALDDIREALRSHGERYLRRVFTPHEIEAAGGPEDPDVAVLARTFAAKEALAKALAVDRNPARPLPWTDVEVRQPPTGPIQLVLSGAAAGLAAERHVQALTVSTTMQGDLAAAIVMAGAEPR